MARRADAMNVLRKNVENCESDLKKMRELVKDVEILKSKVG